MATKGAHINNSLQFHTIMCRFWNLITTHCWNLFFLPLQLYTHYNICMAMSYTAYDCKRTNENNKGLSVRWKEKTTRYVKITFSIFLVLWIWAEYLCVNEGSDLDDRESWLCMGLPLKLVSGRLTRKPLLNSVTACLLLWVLRIGPFKQSGLIHDSEFFSPAFALSSNICDWLQH